MSLRRLLALPVWLALAVLPALVSAAGPPPTDAQGNPLPDGARARLGTLRWRPGTQPVFLAFLPGGKEVLSVDRESVVQFWERESGRERRRFDAAAGPPARGPGVPPAFLPPAVAALSGDGKTLALCGRDGAVYVWDVPSGKQRLRLAGAAAARRVEISADGTVTAAALVNGSVALWDEDGNALSTVSAREALGRLGEK